MEVWVIFQSYSWCDADWHTEWNIYGIYSSEAKAKEEMYLLYKEKDDFDETEYRMEKHSVK